MKRQPELLLQTEKRLCVDYSASGESDDKPPPNKVLMGAGSGGLPANGALAGRPENFRELWRGDWDIPVARGVIPHRCLFVFKDI